MSTATSTRDAYRLRAHEIWGGNEAGEERVTVFGFEGWVSAVPHEGDKGGDLRFVSTCAGGQIVRFTLADIAGHGEAASDWAIRLRGLIRKHINTPNPAKFARALNWEFSRVAEAGGFATAIIVTYFAPTDHLVVCNAGHPRPLLRRAASGSWELFDEGSAGLLPVDRAKETGVSNLPLGIVAPTTYPMFATRLDPGDIVVAYTDALIEAADAEGRALGERGLLEIASSQGPGDPEVIGRAILGEVRARRGGEALDDDATLLVLRHTATDPPSGAFAKIQALGRLVGLFQ